MEHGKRHVCTKVSEREFHVITRAAAAADLTVADFVRRCVNGYFLEQGDDAPLLEEKEIRRRRAESSEF